MATKSKNTRFHDYFTLTDKDLARCEICYQDIAVNIRDKVKEHLIKCHNSQNISLDDSNIDLMLEYYNIDIQNNKFNCKFYHDCGKSYNSFVSISNATRHLLYQHNINKDTYEKIGNCLRETYKFDKNSHELIYRCTMCDDTSVPNRSASIMSHLFYAHDIDISERNEIKILGFSISSISLINMASETGWTKAFIKDKEKKTKCLICNNVSDSSKEVIINHINKSHNDFKGMAKDFLNLVSNNFYLTITQSSKCKNCNCIFIKRSLYELMIHLKLTHNDIVTIPLWIQQQTNKSLEREIEDIYVTFKKFQNIPSYSYQHPSRSNVYIMTTKDTRFADYFKLIDEIGVKTARCEVCYEPFPIEVESGILKKHLEEDHKDQISSLDQSRNNWMMEYYKIHNNSITCIFPDCGKTYDPNNIHILKRHLNNKHHINKDTAKKIAEWLQTYQPNKSSSIPYYCRQKDCNVSVPNRSAFIMSHLFYAHQIDPSENSEIKKMGFEISSTFLIDMNSTIGRMRAYFIIEEKKTICNICNKICFHMTMPVEDMMRNHMQESHKEFNESRVKELLNLALKHFYLTISQAPRCKHCSFIFQKISLFGLMKHLKIIHKDEAPIPPWISLESVNTAIEGIYDPPSQAIDIRSSSSQQSSTSHVDVNFPLSESGPSDPKKRRTD